MNSRALDCLPPEMICKILKNLNLNELINCKLVCKQWYSIIFQSIKLTKIVVIADYGDEEFWRSRWYHSNELINQNLDHCKFNSFLSHFKQNILSNLKQLKIDKKLPASFDLNKLNLFTELIHLEINYRFEEKCNLNLNLSNLEVLKFKTSCSYLYNSNCHPSIECAKLKVLSHYTESGQVNLNIKYPESVKDLQTEFFGEQLTRFKNVEHLKIYPFNIFKIMNETTLTNLRNLKEITCIDSISEVIEFNFVSIRISEMKSILKNFLKSAKQLKMSDLKLSVAGVQLTEHNIDLIDFGLVRDERGRERIDDTHFYSVNYKYLQVYLPSIYKVDYTQLLKSIRQIPKDYFTKFFAIERVTATGLIDQEHFLWFLKNLDCLKELNLRDTNLTQSFFDELPTFCSLTYFSLIDGEDLELNFEFIAKFIKLVYLEIDKNLSLKSATSLIKAFGNSKYFFNHTLCIKIKNIVYFIRRKSKGKDVCKMGSIRDNSYDVGIVTDYVNRIWNEGRTLKKNLKLDQVVRYFDNNHTKIKFNPSF